ncbi:MAG: hypothetical protein K9I94_15780 [Bacteroidales bacterium]|nr:hypothetical protein [Bacteroidales bacterium]
MKTKSVITAMLLVVTMISAQAQKNEGDYILAFGKEKTHTLGLYGGLYGSYSEVQDLSSGYLGYRLGAVINEKWGFGFAGFGLSNDHTMRELVSDGTYHMQAGYAGMFVEYIQPIGRHVNASFSVISAAGLIKYQYDKAFAKEKVWHEDIIDQDTYGVFEPGIELQTRLSKNWWIGAYATYRTTSPIKMLNTEEDVLENYTAGISIKLGKF